MDRLFIDFANSEWYDGRGNLEDRLLDPRWRRGFLRRWGLSKHAPLDEITLNELVDLRSAIRSIVQRLAVPGHGPTRSQLKRLNKALAGYPVRFRLSEVAAQPDLDVEPLAGGSSPAVAGAIALSTARFLTGGEIDRLKMCDNAGCRWVFYDETKNRRRRWCGPCGNVDRVRRFRERRRLERANLPPAHR